MNHSVVLVGWDDQQGPAGVWIVRNSWGSGWGEQGYMRIAYDCSSIGHAACYINYAGMDDLNVTPTTDAIIEGKVGGPFWPPRVRYSLTNNGATSVEWIATRAANWLQIVPSVGTLAPGASEEVYVCTTGHAGELSAANHENVVTFTNTISGRGRQRTVRLRVGQGDHLTEIFDKGDNDLAHRSILFTPDGSANYYTACSGRIDSLPTDPTGSTDLSAGDDAAIEVSVVGKSVMLYGQAYSRLFVGSNGYITLSQSDNSSQETIAGHFDRKRIAALYDDLDPTSAGSVTFKQLADRVAVTWLRVPEFDTTNENTFQIELFFDGRIRISWLGIAATDGLAGLSRGAGIPPGFQETDLSDRAPCQDAAHAKADLDDDGDIDMADFGRMQRCLTGMGIELQLVECIDSRLDLDGDVDDDDLAVFAACASGPGLPADARCGT